MDTGRPVALVRDEVLLDELLRLAAAAGCELDRVPDAAALRARWKDAPLVLLDEWAAFECGQADLPRRAGAYLVSTGPPSEQVWPQTLVLGLERVVVLPAGGEWLIGTLADLAEGPPSGEGRVVAVLGGRGGAGASVLAAALGQAVLSSGRQGLLVDCDPLGGGLDLTLGDESHEGPRWPELHLSGGRVAASALHSALPGRSGKHGRLTVLSCDRDGPGPEPDAVAAVVEAGRRAGETVICDLPRHLTVPALAALSRTDLAVLVVPAEVRACASAKRMAHQLTSHGVTLGLVVRAPGPTGLRGKEIAESVGVPLLASMRPEPRLATALDNGRFPTTTRGPLARAANSVLTALHNR
ncbi:septum site-determining protein Ssd [Umezawaea sp. Da 62-37]|uniref:septum site-determining protein Ssd n=1 Tax=Umezawaea sp. Da 62-37 TaxID=3075927 RepID=UPI0028F717AF|nr:septum site-determining protein Ssd [Umezawaea sp. Da 62-37]WNV91718.1 CpaE-like family protein [Umezawaea sp. Da 62-37]